MPSPNGKCATTPGESGSKSLKRRKPEAPEDESPGAKRRSEQPSTSQAKKLAATPKSAPRARKPKEKDGVFDEIFNLMDTSMSDNKKNKGNTSKSPPRDRQKPSTSSEAPKYISLQTRDDLMRHDSDNRMAYEFLKKEGLMERLLGHKMLKGRIEPYSYLGFVRREPLHKPLPPEVFTAEFTKSCLQPKGPPGPRTPPGPGPQTPSGSPDHNSSGRSSPAHITNGFEENGNESPQKCTTPPPPPPILMDGGSTEESNKDVLLRQMAQMTDTPVDKLESYFGKDLQNAMGKLDKKTLLAKLKGALKEMTGSDTGRNQDVSREDAVAMDIASDASDNSATVDDDEQQRYTLSPLLLPPPPAPATPPLVLASSPPPPPPPFAGQQFQVPPPTAAPARPPMYPPPGQMHSQMPPHSSAQMPADFAPHQPPPMFQHPPPMEPNYGPINPAVHRQLPPSNFPPPNMQQPPPPIQGQQHLLPLTPAAPLSYPMPPPPLRVNTSLPPPNMCQPPPIQSAQQQRPPTYLPPPNMSFPPPGIPPVDVSVPPPSFSTGPLPPMSQPPPALPQPLMSAPVRFTEPPPPVTPAHLSRPPPHSIASAASSVSLVVRPSGSEYNLVPGQSTPVMPRFQLRGREERNSRRSFGEADLKRHTETERKVKLTRSVQELNKAVASEKEAVEPTEGKIMKTLMNALAVPVKEEKRDLGQSSAVRAANSSQHQSPREGQHQNNNCEQNHGSEVEIEVPQKEAKEVGFFDEEEAPCSSAEQEAEEEAAGAPPAMPAPRPLASIPMPPMGRFGSPGIPPFFGNHFSPGPNRFRPPLNAMRYGPPPPPIPFHPFYGPPRRGMQRTPRPQGPYRPRYF
ncbi:hypothetical protein L596_008015 [Steinernema carpocapsae]|uniref:Uncharacterized protein n=1 Tax=Steinernema carpocapsae TaxID=34508 RepID=A0A4U5PBR2_STECR|nr:hypothetical protein L596_008015 [Steinernema carpocapsae]